jgi:NAD(P)H dehydrogenase (quinone)
MAHPMNIYLLLAHPDTNSFNGALADAYESRAREMGHEVRRQNLGELTFDLVLWKGKNTTQELEPDLKQAQENIAWCERWVIFYPVWWGSVPALFKGFIDRVLQPEFAFRYHDKDPLWDKLLKGRSAQVFVTSDAPKIWIALLYRNSDIHALKHATLEFCGISPVKVTRFCVILSSDKKRRTAWIDQVRRSVPRALTG